jgi:porin
MKKNRTGSMMQGGFRLGFCSILALTLGYAAHAADLSPSPTASYEDWKAGLKQQGVEYQLAYRSEDLAAVNGSSSKDLVHAGQVALSSKLDMQRLVGWSGASITTSLTVRDGDNINYESDVNALLGQQEIYGRGHYFRLSQFWLDQLLFNDALAIRVGRMNTGEDFQATECSFTNLSFCANQPGNYVADYWFNWPISQWGIAAKLRVGTDQYVKVGAYQVNPRNLGSNFGDVLSFHGGTGVLAPAEFGWTPTSADGRITELKIGGWYSSANRADVYEDVDNQSAAVSGLPFRERDGSYGGFTSLTQQLTRGDASGPNSGLRMVLKGSVADRATSTVDRTFAGTLVYTGTLPTRNRDDVGIALAFNHLNERVSDYREQLPLADDSLLAGGNERTFEAYYSLRIDEFLMFRPDFQWIHNPGAMSERDDVVVVGMRTELTF